MAAKVTNQQRLDAVLSKLEKIEYHIEGLGGTTRSLENEVRQIKRIIQYVQGIRKPVGTEEPILESQVPTGDGIKEAVADDRQGLWPGQLDYQITDRPTVIKQQALEEKETTEQCLE